MVNRVISKEEQLKVFRLRGEGLTHREIEKKACMSRGSVVAILKRGCVVCQNRRMGSVKGMEDLWGDTERKRCTECGKMMFIKIEKSICLECGIIERLKKSDK
ncbi:hypothetical protein LCGC14_2982340 [marine sediment metagenome]|uniref:Uncharacterized protein n=1 Tax=marine sediment metagenome TaxID=412755 RepID=A0A0F8XTR2_9ZZZZ|nr:hypothetical protein [bacterium]